MSNEDEGYVFRKKVAVEKVKIPEGHVKCPKCKGYGEIRRIYGPPHMAGQYTVCMACNGYGYIPKGKETT